MYIRNYEFILAEFTIQYVIILVSWKHVIEIYFLCIVFYDA